MLPERLEGLMPKIPPCLAGESLECHIPCDFIFDGEEELSTSLQCEVVQHENPPLSQRLVWRVCF